MSPVTCSRCAPIRAGDGVAGSLIAWFIAGAGMLMLAFVDRDAVTLCPQIMNDVHTFTLLPDYAAPGVRVRRPSALPRLRVIETAGENPRDHITHPAPCGPGLFYPNGLTPF